MEKDSYSSTTTKSSFIRRSASFGNTSPFSSRGNKHILRAYPSTLKNRWTVFWNNSRTFYNYLKWLARVSPSLRNRNRLCQHTATSTHLLTFQKTLHCTRKQWNYLRSIMYNFQHKIWSQVQTITHTVLLRKQSPGASNLQRGWSCEYIFYSSTTVLNPWSEWTHCMENGESNVFSCLTLPRIESKLHMNINTVKLG